MKRLKLPRLLPARKPPGRHRGKGRATSSSGHGRHRPVEKKVVPPWSQRDDYKGRHHKDDPPPQSGPMRERAKGPVVPGRRQTPADDRGFVARFFR